MDVLIQSYLDGTILTLPDGTLVPVPNNTVKRVCHFKEHIEQYIGSTNVKESLLIDGDTNQALLLDILDHMQEYKLLNGSLTKNDQPVNINADGNDVAFLKQIKAYVTSINNGSITNDTAAVRINKLERAVAFMLKELYKNRIS